MPQDAGSENVYTRPPLISVSFASSTRIWNWVPLAVVGDRMYGSLAIRLAGLGSVLGGAAGAGMISWCSAGRRLR
ncbi:hypothetical protein BCF44_106129 [Kutzneria buriramensis]|uniref:Uncharacterized protein n=1 Tax=Kutzneria buriramensis TaxID=1045776 RepID=A0A3E0HLQ5_9PSEU|nr:hypothetical protein BCF44_106129 [Kutzneria buriramensis]